jgi:hypothetical protein
VTIEDVGTCTVKATVLNTNPRVSASQTFRIMKATPDINAANQSTRFANPMRYAVKVTVSPKIPLKYTIKHRSSEDVWCKVTSAGILTFNHQPTSADFPQIPLDCYVEIAAAASSPDYTTPAPDLAKIHIDYAVFNVVPKPEDIDYSKSPSVTFDIQETTGAALGMDVGVDSGDCTVGPASPVHPTSRTTRYKVTVTAGSSGTYDCHLTASTLPPDYFKGNREASFTVHVKP